MDSLFGEGTSLPVRFFIAFVVVFALIGVTAWLIRRFGSGALGGTNTRGRAPRLAVIEAGAVDGRRKLVLIRRDNIEHLLMIGGPTDIVVEANIVRGQNARETTAARTPSAADSLPRTSPAEETAWPLQPDSAPRPARAAQDATQWPLPAEPAAPVAAAPAPAKRSRSADALAGLAAELSVRPAEPVVAAPPLPTPAARPAPAAEAPRPKPSPAPAPAAAAAPDQNLADMASRLEAALRRPGPAAAPAPAPAPAATARPAAPARVAPAVAPPIAPPAAAQDPVQPAIPATAPIVTIEPEPATADSRADSKPDDVFGSIEQEMANLLGRPSGSSS